jgi:hypothetical protein
MSTPIPDRIHSALIKHNLDLQRYSSGLQLRIENILDQLGKDLAHELMDAGLETSRTAWKTARLRALIDAAGKRIGETYQGIQDLTGSELSELVSITGSGVTTAINDAIGAKLLVAPKWTGEQLASIAGDALIKGAPSAEWWSRQSVGFQQAFADSMRQGMLRGETITEMRDRILPKVDLRRIAPESRPLIWTARRNAEALVRTSVMQVANDAHFAAYQANADIMAGFAWMATLDKRTCIRCAYYDQKQWDLQNQPIGHSDPFPGMPLHFSDRCMPYPITKSWEQLAREAHGNSTLAKELDKIPVGDRASMNGPVSGDTSFESFFSGQDRTWQEEYLGPGRMRLYESGKLSLSDMTDGKGSPYTLDQLRGRK